MTTLQQLTREFKDYYNGSPWFGNSFQTIVDDITPQEALAVPGNGHSIARLLSHMIKWRIALTERLQGNTGYRARDTDPDNWPPLNTLDENAWEQAKNRYDNLQQIIISQLESRDESFLDEEWLPGKTYRYLISGVVQHDIYHLGQISLLKQLMRKAENA